MFQIIGIVLLFAMVFGSYILAGGKMGVILHSLPYELMAILGAAVAAFLIGNSVTTIKATLGGFAKVFAGPKWKRQDYKDLLSLLFQLTKTMKRVAKGGMERALSFRSTFSQVSASAPISLVSTRCRDRLAVRRVSLWQVTQ